jgi:sortase A
VAITAALFSVAIAGQALWIPLKAELAQWLIMRSWEHSVAGHGAVPPWPWADTAAAAVLEVPALGVSQVVLGGNSSRNLAFGPVLLDASSGGQDLVISGHRDTHFRFLRRLQAGDRIRVRHAAGERWYSVAGAEVIDSRSHRLVIEPGLERLSLVTCYPFDSPLAGGPLRYVVTALPFSPRSPSSG